MSLIINSLKEARQILDIVLSDEKLLSNIEIAGNIIVDAFQNNNKIISCGNGGSMSDAMHFAEELSGKFREERPALPAIAISDPAYLSCTANDYGYDKVFSRFIEAFGNQNDVLLAISTSGNSSNVLRAIAAARNKNMKIIGLTGKDGGKMSALCDVELRVPFSKYSDRTQEIHIKLIHILIEWVESKLFSNPQQEILIA